MKKEDILKVEFAVHDGERSDVPSIFAVNENIKIKHFSYGDCFGHDGKSFWLDLNQDLEEFEDVDSEHKEQYTVLRDFLETSFNL